jgi:hypothetical protein
LALANAPGPGQGRFAFLGRVPGVGSHRVFIPTPIPRIPIPVILALKRRGYTDAGKGRPLAPEADMATVCRAVSGTILAEICRRLLGAPKVVRYFFPSAAGASLA